MNHKAFTLLELIVVIIIVGILAVLGLTQYTRVIEK
ncbi:MAG: prepilin-type N-terminal cleavage/methylation domain-containing protein, partial [Candidatus Omnitrophica bacterium]|nr:prepilin-type N-terminal cleavage/methylation domain-containing protein [Candidatus Omnitrophota bacterium]